MSIQSQREIKPPAMSKTNEHILKNRKALLERPKRACAPLAKWWFSAIDIRVSLREAI